MRATGRATRNALHTERQFGASRYRSRLLREIGAPILVEVTGHPEHPSRARAPGVEPTPPRLRRQRRSTVGRAAAKPDDDGPLVRTETRLENDRVADSDETDPDAGRVLDVPDPDTSRIVAPELVDPERRAQHRRWVLDRLERWIP
jgi:hypothetical protein